jgi:hypothetical protein
MPIDPYTLEQAESDIADLRGQVDALTEFIATAQLTVTGPLTATGGTPAVPSVLSTDTWNVVPSLNAGWGSTLAYMLLPLTDLVAVYAHLSCASATTTDGTTICSFPPAYRPQSVTQWMPMLADALRTSGSNNEGAGLSVLPSGQVQCQGVAGAATWVRGVGMYRLSL